MNAISGCIVVLSFSLPTSFAGSDRLSFDRDIRSVLSDNCFQCHGFDDGARKVDLRLDIREGATRDLGGYAAIVPGDPEASELIRRIVTDDPDDLMPPPESHLKLTEPEKGLLQDWIEQGATYEGHWAFQALRKPDLEPGLNPVDHWIKLKLKALGLSLNPPAGPRTLARRYALDLTGLPLSSRQMDAFLTAYDQDEAAAIDALLDRLFASPHYGERMAWDWLAASRYSDTNGYQGDNTRTMWPWRDWVVKAFNENLTWDRFTLWQVAGDLLPDPTQEQVLATAFNRNHPINGEGGRIPEENRVEYVFDMTETMATTWLGLTMECSRCHDHKFDPILQRDYYALFAFFNQTPVDGKGGDPKTPPFLELPSESDVRREKDLTTRLEEARQRSEESPDDEKLKKAFEAVGKSLKRLKADSVRVMVMADQKELRPTFVLERGLYTRPGAEVSAALPATLGQLPEDVKADRLALARWLVSPENPLMARVTVNRLWQMIFGVGLVKTSEDFGTQGERPSHPELLDTLAWDFIEGGWDVQHLLRQILTSQVYRQSPTISARKLEKDPDNRLLSRSPRYRLPSWMLRDQALAASGLLVPTLGGPSVRPYQPEGIWKEASFGKKVYVPGTGDDLYRRSLYTFWRRTAAPTVFFDEARRLTCEVKPSRTNTPLQALTLMNDIGYVEAARSLASNAGSLEVAFQRITLRPARKQELALLQTRLTKLEEHYAQRPEDARELVGVGASEVDSPLATHQLAARTAIINLIFNLDETICRP